jgi:hypothetical protein
VPLRRLLVFFVLCASALLVAAAPKPSPSPSPAPIATQTPFIGNDPVVIIYPFEAPSDLDPKYGGAIAQIYSQVLNQTGGVKVLPVPANIKREDYDKFAHVQHADYYVSGYIQPIGAGAAIVSQVVDVEQNISVYSATTQISDVQDVGSQALTARTVILQAAGIDRPELNAGPAQTPTPSSTSGASVPITNVLSDLFKGKGKGKSVATAPTATPIPAKPPRGVIVAHLTGSAQASDLSAGTDDLYRALYSHFNTTLSSAAATANVGSIADSLCGTNRDNTVVSGELNVQHVGGFRPHDSFTFTLNVYACFGARLYSTTSTNDSRTRAIHDAVESYFGDHPENNG